MDGKYRQVQCNARNSENFVSPRLGVAYRIERAKTVLHAGYNRFLETPALENLLLSSSEQAR